VLSSVRGFLALDQGLIEYVDHQAYVEYRNSGCNNWERIQGPRAYLMTLEDCHRFCTTDPDCVSFNYQDGTCEPSDGSGLENYCIVFYGQCDMGTNTCMDLYVKTNTTPVGPAPVDSNETTCDLVSNRTNMAVIASPAYDKDAPFPNFSSAQEKAAYVCVSWTATALNCDELQCVGTASLRDIYPKLIGSPVCSAMARVLANELLMGRNCSQLSEMSSVMSLLEWEVTQVCAVGAWFSQLSLLYDAILRQQQSAFQRAMSLLDMQTSTFVLPPPSSSSGGDASQFISFITGTLSTVNTILGAYGGFGALTKFLGVTNTIIGDANKIGKKGGFFDKAQKKFKDSSSSGFDALTWVEQKLYKEQAAAVESYNKGHLKLEQLLEVVDGLLLAVQEIFKAQARAIAANAGKLKGGYAITIACPLSTADILLQVAATKQAQLWRGLVFLMPTRYAVYMQRDMGMSASVSTGGSGRRRRRAPQVVTNPPCFDYNSFAVPRPKLADYNTSGQELDWCDSQDITAYVPYHFESYTRRRTNQEQRTKVPPTFTTNACKPSSRRIWLGVVGSPSQLAPDTFWEALGSDSGLLPTFINSVYNLSIEPGAESAWRTMLGLCENVTRFYSPDLSSVNSNQWSGGLQGLNGWPKSWTGNTFSDSDVTTVGWSVIASSVDAKASPTASYKTVEMKTPSTEMKKPSTLSGVCNMFGIPLQVYPLPDCHVTSTMWDNNPLDQPNPPPSSGLAPSSPTCVNGFSVSTANYPSTASAPTPTQSIGGPLAQLTSFNQNGLVPTGCANRIMVMGAAFFDLFGMGYYERLPQQHEGRPVYMKADPERFMYFNKSQQAWILGAEVINGPGLTITYANEDDVAPYRSDTPCPILGTVWVNASTPDWINKTLPIWTSAASLESLSNTTVSLTDPYPNPYTPQVKTCCVPWGAAPSDCKHAVCDCNGLYGLVSVRMITTQQYQKWLGQCAYCTFYGGDDGLSEWAGGVDVTSKVYTGGCGKMTSAGPLDLVLQGNIDSPPPA
jgi:hypothetical protein